jgi:hypothetical protein
MPRAPAQLRDKHPRVHVDLKLIEPEDSLIELQRGRTDLAIVVGPREQRGDDIVLTHLVDDGYRAVLPKGHHLATKRVIDLAVPRMGLGTRHRDVVVRTVRNPEPVRRIFAAVRQTALAQPAMCDLLDALRNGPTK